MKVAVVIKVEIRLSPSLHPLKGVGGQLNELVGCDPPFQFELPLLYMMLLILTFRVGQYITRMIQFKHDLLHFSNLEGKLLLASQIFYNKSNHLKINFYAKEIHYQKSHT